MALPAPVLYSSKVPAYGPGEIAVAVSNEPAAWVATVERDGAAARVRLLHVNLLTGAIDREQMLDGPVNTVSLACSTDGVLLAIGTGPRLHLLTGDALDTMPQPAEEVRFSPDADEFASRGSRGICFWGVEGQGAKAEWAPTLMMGGSRAQGPGFLAGRPAMVRITGGKIDLDVRPRDGEKLEIALSVPHDAGTVAFGRKEILVLPAARGPLWRTRFAFVDGALQLEGLVEHPSLIGRAVDGGSLVATGRGRTVVVLPDEEVVLAFAGDRPARETPLKGKKPSSVAISADGGVVAIGCASGLQAFGWGDLA